MLQNYADCIVNCTVFALKEYVDYSTTSTELQTVNAKVNLAFVPSVSF